MLIGLVAVMVLALLGFFWLMFAEMGTKREKGRFSASRGTGGPGGGGGRSPRKGRVKTRPRKSR